MNKVTFTILLLSIGIASQAQFFAPMPNYSKKEVATSTSRFGTRAVTPADTSSYTVWAVRPVVGLGAVVSSTGQLVTGAGVSIENDTYAQQKWTTNISLSWLLWAIGSVGPDAGHPTIGTGPAVGLVNKLILVGGLYNFGTHQIGAVANIGLGFNNGASNTVTQLP